MRVNYIFLIFCFLGALISCSDTKEAIEPMNSKPGIFLIKKGERVSALTDSVRRYTGSVNYYNFKLALADSNSNLWKTSYRVDSGLAKIYYRGSELFLPSIRVDVSEVILAASSERIGMNVISFVAEDRFGKTAEAKLRLFVFDNLIPIAELKFSTSGNRLFVFDGSASRDPDANFGGGVSSYVFEIDGKEFQTSEPIIRHIFAVSGVYTVRLKVIDNFGATSPVVARQILVQ